MADRPNTRHGLDIEPGAASGAEARMFHDIVKNLGGLPPGVRRVDFQFGDDSDGTPAVWISFVADDDVRPSKEKIADLRSMMNKVRAEVLLSDTDRWPYVEIVTE